MEYAIERVHGLAIQATDHPEQVNEHVATIRAALDAILKQKEPTP